MIAAALAACLALLVPSYAYANAGTALMWATAAHLVLGNAIIGTIEGGLIAKLWSARPYRCVGLMILANYLSASVGLSLVLYRLPNALLGREPLAALPYAIAVLVAACFAVSVLIEWPFVALALRGAEGLATRSLRASLAAQTSSYTLLIPWFALASSAGLLTNVERSPTLVAAVGCEVEVFYVGPKGDAVFRSCLDGTAARKVADLPPGSGLPSLAPLPATDGPYWDLRASRLALDDDLGMVVVPHFAARTEVSGKRTPSFGGSWKAPRPDLREDLSEPRFQLHLPRAFSWAAEGIFVKDKQLGTSWSTGLEVPGFAWRTKSATALPRDQVVFELSSSPPQIVLLDLQSRQVGLVALGSSPVAMWKGAIPERVEP